MLNWLQPHEGPRYEVGDHVSKIVVNNDDLHNVTQLLADTNVDFETHSDLQEKITESINIDKPRDHERPNCSTRARVRLTLTPGKAGTSYHRICV